MGRLGPDNVGQVIAKLKINHARLMMEYPDFTKQTLKKIMNDEVILPIQLQMRRDGISEKIVKKTRIEFVQNSKRGTITYKVISDYKAINGFPVAIMIERGRRGFWLYPLNKKALSWLGKLNNKRYFSKGHYIPPYRARRYVWNMVHQKRHVVRQKFQEESEQFLNNILSS